MKKTAYRLIKNIKLVTIVFFLITTLLCGYFLLTSPVAFQKSVAIKFVEKTELKQNNPKSWIDIREILQKIPYKENKEMVHEVKPKQKYLKTIQEGFGNCSNLAFGLGYYLSKHNHEYQIVHIMPPDEFLLGVGHTVVSTPYTIDGQHHYGIVDILEGGLPLSENKFININSFRKGSLINPSILSLNQNKDNYSPYYEKFLNKSIIGVLKSDDIQSYFNFIDAIYIPLGNKKLEKLLYDGLSVVFGYYPPIYVFKGDANSLFKNNKTTKYFANLLLVSIRIFLFLFLFLTVLYTVSIVKNHITKFTKT